MQLGIYVPDGRPLSYDESTGKFDLGGMSVTLNALVSWDALNEVAWDRPDLRTWALTLPRTPAAAPAPQGVKKKSNLAALVALLVLLILLVCGVVVAGNMPTASTPNSSDSVSPGTAGPAQAPAESQPVQEPAAPTLNMGQKQAVGKAKDYLAYSSFSRKGLIEQLVFSGFNEADAAFAVDQIAPDWNAQAAGKAKDYLAYSSFSRQGLIEQLVFSGFTPAQAEYGAKAVGY